MDIIWLMDSECCCECGTGLLYFESVLCTNCLHDAWYNDDQDLLDAWFYDDDQAQAEPPA